MALTLEFLIAFASTLVLIFILSSTLNQQRDHLLKTTETQYEVFKTRHIARIGETELHDNKIYSSDFSSMNYIFRVQNGRVVVSYYGKRNGVIEAQGIFRNDGKEPV